MISGFNHVIIEEPWLPEEGRLTNTAIISALNSAVENMKPLIMTFKYPTKIEIDRFNVLAVIFLTFSRISSYDTTMLTISSNPFSFSILGIYYFYYQKNEWYVGEYK